jgi:hypothetical protein
MRALFVSCCLFAATTASFAQLSTCLNTSPQMRGLSKVSLKPMNTFQDIRVASRSPYEPAFSVSGLNFGGEARTVPGLGMTYVPRSNAAGRFVFGGGFLWSSGGSTTMLDPRLTRVQRTQVSYAQNVVGTSFASLGLGYVGAEYRYYLLQGDIQPNVGVGARALGGLYGNSWGVSAAPVGMAGLNLQISTIFSGFAEVQHAPGVGLGLGGFDSFRGMTSIAFGFAFAPQFMRW